MRYFIVPLGCQMNRSDAERLATVLEGMGFEPGHSEEDADILGVVACSVRQKSINKAYGRIHKWNQWKDHKNLLTFLSGCILPADEENFTRLFDLVFRINDLPQLPQIIRQYGVTTPLAHQALTATDDLATAFWKIEPKYSCRFLAYVPIQNGCDKFCTFCAVPYTRGREVSRPSIEILQEVQALVAAGYKSITLLGQNVNSYGRDRCGQEMGFSQLLAEIGKRTQDSEYWLYYTSPHPSDMSEEVLEVMATYPCLARHVHLPIQSGDDEILQRMNRSYTIADYRQIVSAIRRHLPEATLFTDIIVGFSGETGAQFANTIAALQEFRFNMAYIAQYSPRPGAKSYRWPDDVPIAEKKSRHQQLTDELKAIALALNRQMVGRCCRVLVEGPARKAGYLAARSEGLIPVHFPSDEAALIGKFVTLEINAATPFALAGELV